MKSKTLALVLAIFAKVGKVMIGVKRGERILKEAMKKVEKMIKDKLHKDWEFILEVKKGKERIVYKLNKEVK